MRSARVQRLMPAEARLSITDLVLGFLDTEAVRKLIHHDCVR